MIQGFNSAKEYFERMRKQGSIKLTHDSAASLEKLIEMNEELEKMRQDFLMKEGRSMNEAKSIVINA